MTTPVRVFSSASLFVKGEDKGKGRFFMALALRPLNLYGRAKTVTKKILFSGFFLPLKNK
jgi:hypothetical protein